MHARSVAKAVRLANEAFYAHDSGTPSGLFGGGVPVLATLRIWKDGKLILDRTS